MKETYSRYIRNGIILKRTNIFIQKFIKIFFRKIDFDKESYSILQKYADKGHIAYISYQNANSALLILASLLSRHKFKMPVLALDFNPYLVQTILTYITVIVVRIKRFFSSSSYVKISNYEYINRLFDRNETLVLSLLSSKFFLKRYLKIESDSLEYLVQVQKNTDKPIYIFPQIMFWNYNPERTKALLVSKATGDRSLLSALFTMLKSITPAYMRIAEPLNLKEELENSKVNDIKQITHNIRNKLLEIYNHEKRATLGPIIKSQQEIQEKVLYHKNVLDTISEVIIENQTSEKRLRKNAYKYFKEIAADFSIIYIKSFDWVLKHVFNKIFDGIYYNIEDFKMIREANQNGPLILLPNHRSHMDYLIISSLFYRNKIIPPHIVAGANLTFFPMGKVFRKCGAFFIRRSFKGHKLYASVLKQYIKMLVHEGYNIEFFIEGGRSRTGKLVFPKMGILKYLIESVEEGYNKDLVFVPISLNYDRILEESSYTNELRGSEKKAESTSTFVKSRKLLKRQYGRVYVSFNKPVNYTELIKNISPEEDTTTAIGNYVIKKINEVIKVTPFATTSASILMSSSKGFTRSVIKDKLSILLDYLQINKANISDVLQDSDNFDEIIDYVLDSYKKDHIIMELDQQNDNPELKGLFIIKEEERARLNLYKNNIIHFLLPIAFTATALLKNANSPTIENIISGFNRIKEIFSHEFIYNDFMYDPIQVVSASIEFLESKNFISRAGGTITVIEDKTDYIQFFAKLIKEYFESYLIVLESIDNTFEMNRKDLIHEIRKVGIKLYHLGEIKLSESLSLPVYENALKKIESLHIIRVHNNNERNASIEMADLAKAKELNKELRSYLKVII